MVLNVSLYSYMHVSMILIHTRGNHIIFLSSAGLASDITTFNDERWSSRDWLIHVWCSLQGLADPCMVLTAGIG